MTAAADRPTCLRCGQRFRRSGAGLAWHLANRPDCAPAADPDNISAGDGESPAAGIVSRPGVQGETPGRRVESGPDAA